MKKRNFAKLALILTSMLTIGMCVGCGGASTPTAATGNQIEQTSGDGIHLKYSLTEELNSLDPNYNYSATSMNMILTVGEGLYKYMPDGTIGLGMASNVDISEDGLTYTFTIRDDAYWSNGDKVTSNDYLYSWRRLANPDNGCTYAYMLVTAGIKNAYNVIYNSDQGYTLDDLGISAPDDKTFVVELDAAKPYLTELLAIGTYLMPVNQKFCEECGDQFMLDPEHSIYCGPYKMSKWEVGGTSYTLTKNESYYDADNVKVDTIDFTLLTDEQQKILSWENGDLDQIQLTGDYVEMYKDDPSKYTQLSAGLFFIAFNTENANLQNKNLRLAISTAIDKKTLTESILKDGSIPADYMIPDQFANDSKGVCFRERIGHPTYNEYDLTKAADYWEKAKAELGTDNLSIELLYNEDSVLASVAAYIQSQLQTNLPGLTVNLRCTSYNQRLADMGNGNYEMGITRWYADYQDASTFLDMWTKDSNLNYENWVNDEYNDLYAKVTGEYAMDEDKRIEAQKRMEQIFEEDAAACALYQPSMVYLRNTNYTFLTTQGGFTLYKYTDKVNP